jgi:hypothetical protein
MTTNSLYIDMRYESNDLKFDAAGKPPIFVRSDSVVVIGQVAGNLSGLVVKASVCKVLPDGSIGPPVYSRTVGNGITMSSPSPNERRVAVSLIQVGENAADRPGQQYVADIEFSYNQDFSVGTTVGTPVPMRRTIKGAFGIEEDYTII